MRFSWKENIFVVLICFLGLLIQGAVVAHGCNATIASFPAGVKLQLLFPRFMDWEASPNFRGHRIKRNGTYFAVIDKESRYGQCIKDIADVVLKNFCLQKATFSKVNNKNVMLKISSPDIYDSGCYTVHWEFKNVESKDPEGIYVDVNKVSGSPTNQSPATASTLNKDNVSHNPSSPSLAPAAASDASFTAIKQRLYLCCLLLVIVL